GLRCISILAVIVYHATGPHGPTSPLLKLGIAGVTLFFTISGFLITTLLLREQQAYGRIDLPAFYVRRSLRIFPLYYLVLLLYVLLVWLVEPDAALRSRFFENLPAFATYTSNWFVDLDGDRVIFFYAWSLATEEQFYLFWPSVEQHARGASPWLMLLLIVFVELTWVEAIPMNTSGLIHRVILSFAPAIGFGVILAHLMHNERPFRRLRVVLGHRATAAIALIALAVSVAFGAPELVVCGIMAMLVGACCMREDNTLARALRWPLVARAGTVSYGMYLMHMLFLKLARLSCEKLGITNQWVQFAVGLALVFASAWVSYNTYESWFLKLKLRFARGEQPRPSAPTPGSESSELGTA
ncbi:MAG: acyltransferase 3, partial [Myxococcaceae bacterium]|nr:acyltransferase 3 [Myxococcaceae bacterium]